MRRFQQLDVFTAVPLKGNPLAVVVDGDGLSEAQMQAFARWTNLSETTFLLPPTDPAADYRVRIFCPGGELAFAGHPTLGSCQAWLASGGRPRQAGRIVQQCGIGAVTVRQCEGRLAFDAPPLRRHEALAPEVLEQVRGALGQPDVLEAAWIDNGAGWLGVRLASAAQVLALRPDFPAMGRLKIGVIGAHPPGHGCAFEVRGFVPGYGTPEDPVTGSLQAALARWGIGAGWAPPRYVASQGAVLGRDGRVHVEQDGAAVWIGGDVVTLVQGQVAL